MKKRLLVLLAMESFCLSLMQPLFAQSGMVTGKVTDEKGEGIPGASITVKGSQQGTLTTAEGTYSLEAPSTGTLVFSFVGYLKQEININGQSSINVSLQTDTKALEEVVVVGYGTQRKIETTGSIASVKAADLLQTPVANLAQGLQSRVSGVQINQNTGAPGGNVSVRIRGTNSINGSSEPLYVIDGIQIANSGGITDVSPLSTINPNDIESIEVLKDASASAIYGARAANRVILITTKRGKTGVTRVTYDTYYGTQRVIAAFLKSKRVARYMVEIGGEIICEGLKDDGKSWIAGIEDPLHPGSLIATVNLNGLAMTIAGNYRNHFTSNGQIFNHIINPKTGSMEQTSLLSVTVFAKDAITADGYDTAFFVMGLVATKAFLSERKDLDVYLIYTNEKGGVETFASGGIKDLIKETIRQ